ncbi:hypothetical protein LMG28688_05514 [Paraburkholderia caffeinitolerans]|uniref:Uncharacterized protein n=1 Tax=Paraburkholderia caffeinitolerans TaxID=1723730 RepID=A0A6J5GM28_9BURK|nr:hypothetical protein LMG28688_05514 [Paraburkholderia caffeinitolerans]
MRLTTSSNFGRNAGGMQWTSIFIVVVGSVTLNDTNTEPNGQVTSVDGGATLP